MADMKGFGKRIAYGGDYNPEQWAEAVWTEDAKLMQQAGVNLVTVGVFAWALVEPQPGHYDFGWLDRVLDLLHAHKIAVDLATATASPPPWLARQYPDSLPVTVEGTTLWPGGRQHYCPSSPAYKKHAFALVERIAQRYARHPALVLWHINNEYGCHVPACYCDICATAFRVWLRERYQTLDHLNRAWGTSFWSQRYADWEEVMPPRRAPTFTNPAHELDFRRFCSDALLDLFRGEHAILTRYTPDIPVTTNFMGFFKPLDYWTWAREEDLISNDSYPDPAEPTAHVQAAATHDLVRSLGGGRPWVLMEQAPSRVNWRRRNVAKTAGQMRLWSYQAIARGADGVLFFQWRASRAGAEKFHGGMLPHAGTLAPSWNEVVQVGREIATLGEVAGTRVMAQAAIVFDWPNWWALELPSKPAEIGLLEQVARFYQPLYQANITVDFVSPGASLADYPLVLVPNLYLVDDHAAAALERYVLTGGTLVVSFFSGIVDEHDCVRPGAYPSPWTTLLGLSVTDVHPYAEGATGRARTQAGDHFTVDLWADRIVLDGAQALAVYEDGPLAGAPVVTYHKHGAGTAFYVGTRLDPGGIGWLLQRAGNEAAVAPVLTTAPGIEAVRRSGAGVSYLFLLNHGDAVADVSLPVAATDLLSGAVVATVRLEPGGLAVMREAARDRT